MISRIEMPREFFCIDAETASLAFRMQRFGPLSMADMECKGIKLVRFVRAAKDRGRHSL
jgi:hypothetical protein